MVMVKTPRLVLKKRPTLFYSNIQVSMKKNIPNILTSLNLLCGCVGIVSVFENWAFPAAYFIWLAGLFDFFDGFAARLLKVSSPIGKELDSLADMVSFGVLPAVVMYKLIGSSTTSEWLPFLAFAIAAFSALRLAIFNIDETQSDSFKGLPTPANALFISGIAMVNTSLAPWLFDTLSLVLITVTFSLLLVAPIRLFALKFKNFGWKENKIRFTFLLMGVLLIATMKIIAIPLIILLYIGLSLGVQSVSKKT